MALSISSNLKKAGLDKIGYQAYYQKLSMLIYLASISTGNYKFKVNNRNSRTRCEICSELPVSIAKFKQVNDGKY